MFGPLGFPEVIFILVLALLIFGPKRLPEIGRTIGRGLAEFRKASTELKRTINTELALEESPGKPLGPWAESPSYPQKAPEMTAPRPLHASLEAPAESEASAEPDDRPEPEGANIADIADTADSPSGGPLEPR